MTLPTSGPLSLADIQTEFGGSNPISLDEYYAGGANVPSGTTGTYGAVPTTGAISIQNFYGTSKSTSETHSLTTGNTGPIGSRIRGYNAATATGSLTPTTTAIGGATAILAVYYDENSSEYVLSVNGGTNTGWTTMTVDGLYPYNRTSASYGVYGAYTWAWSTSDTISTQVFGANLSTHSIVFT